MADLLLPFNQRRAGITYWSQCCFPQSYQVIADLATFICLVFIIHDSFPFLRLWEFNYVTSLISPSCEANNRITIKICLVFRHPSTLLLCSQYLATSPHPEPYPVYNLSHYFFKTQLNIIVPFAPTYSKWPFSFRIFNHNLCALLPHPNIPHVPPILLFLT